MHSTAAFATQANSGITPTAVQLAEQTASAPTLLIEAYAGAGKTTTLALAVIVGKHLA